MNRRRAIKILAGGAITVAAAAGAYYALPPEFKGMKPTTQTTTTQPTATQLGPRYGGTMHYAHWGQGPPKNLNPMIAFDTPAYQVVYQIYEKLVLYNVRTFENYPQLAQSWQTSSDAKKYTFNLVRNATWHDGKPFTSADVKFTLEALIGVGQGGPMWARVNSIEKIETPDDYTVVVTHKTPNGAWISDLAQGFSGLYMVPKHLFEGTDLLKNPYNLKPVGTGPFKFVESTASIIRMARYENYWQKDKPYLDEVVHRMYANPPTMLTALEAKDIDVASGGAIDASQFQRLSARSDLVSVKWDHTQINYIAFNLTKAPFSDKRVRYAIAHAIDRQGMSAKLGGLNQPVDGTYLPIINWAYNPDAKQPEYNPDKAKQLLDEAGYKPGGDGIRFKTSLLLITFTIWPDIAAIVRDDLSKVGIDCEIKNVESASWFPMQQRGEYDMGINSGAHGPDPHEYRNQVASYGFRNVMKYNNPRVDELFSEGVSVSAREERAKYYFEIQKILAEDMPRLNLLMDVRMAFHPPEFHGGYWEPTVPAGEYDHTLMWTEKGKPSP